MEQGKSCKETNKSRINLDMGYAKTNSDFVEIESLYTIKKARQNYELGNYVILGSRKRTIQIRDF